METVEDLYEATRNGHKGATLKADENHGYKKGGNKCFARSSEEDKTTNQSKNAAKNGWKKRKAGGMWCKLHEATTHNTEDCKVLQQQIANMRSTWNAQHPNVKSRRTSYASSPKNRERSEQEMHAMFEKLLETHRAGKATNDKKCAHKQKRQDNDELSDDDEDLNAFEHLRLDETDSDWDVIDELSDTKSFEA